MYITLDAHDGAIVKWTIAGHSVVIKTSAALQQDPQTQAFQFAFHSIVTDNGAPTTTDSVQPVNGNVNAPPTESPDVSGLFSTFSVSHWTPGPTDLSCLMSLSIEYRGGILGNHGPDVIFQDQKFSGTLPKTKLTQIMSVLRKESS